MRNILSPILTTLALTIWKYDRRHVKHYIQYMNMYFVYAVINCLGREGCRSAWNFERYSLWGLPTSKKFLGEWGSWLKLHVVQYSTVLCTKLRNCAHFLNFLYNFLEECCFRKIGLKRATFQDVFEPKN